MFRIRFMLLVVLVVVAGATINGCVERADAASLTRARAVAAAKRTMRFEAAVQGAVAYGSLQCDRRPIGFDCYYELHFTNTSCLDMVRIRLKNGSLRRSFPMDPICR